MKATIQIMLTVLLLVYYSSGYHITKNLNNMHSFQLSSNNMYYKIENLVREDTSVMFPPNCKVDNNTIGINAAKSNINLAFIVYGDPMALSRHRSTKYGITYNPSAIYQKQFLDCCKPILPQSPLTGPLRVALSFFFRRPKSHYRSGKYSHLLKDNCEIWHTKRGDIDNLAKFVLDALNGAAYLDDSQISMLCCEKLYTNADKPESRIQVEISAI